MVSYSSTYSLQYGIESDTLEEEKCVMYDFFKLFFLLTYFEWVVCHYSLI